MKCNRQAHVYQRWSVLGSVSHSPCRRDSVPVRVGSKLRIHTHESLIGLRLTTKPKDLEGIRKPSIYYLPHSVYALQGIHSTERSMSVEDAPDSYDDHLLGGYQ